MAITFISKGEADQAAVQKSLKERNTEVLFKNRFGREVIIRQYEAKKMVRRGEGEIVKTLGELRKKSAKREKMKASKK